MPQKQAKGISWQLCLAHMRRKFIEAKGNNKKTEKADVALNLIGKLSKINQPQKSTILDSKKPNPLLASYTNGCSSTKIKSRPKWR
ncbi:transposase [Pseudoalteromonas sp. APC 3691]|nr:MULTISPECIES: transposase [Pseudoalteromonas]MDN3390340.1 transposase [Pseudoalteromonas sp. APC 3691]